MVPPSSLCAARRGSRSPRRDPALHIAGILGVELRLAVVRLTRCMSKTLLSRWFRPTSTSLGCLRSTSRFSAPDALVRASGPSPRWRRCPPSRGGSSRCRPRPAGRARACVLGPEVLANAALGVAGDHPVVGLADRAQPDVEHVGLGGREVGELPAVRRDPGLRLDRVAEETPRAARAAAARRARRPGPGPRRCRAARTSSEGTRCGVLTGNLRG
jgi:hypothetical protein